MSHHYHYYCDKYRHYYCDKYRHHKQRAAYYMEMAEKHKCDKKKYRYYYEKYYYHKHKADYYKMGCKHPGDRYDSSSDFGYDSYGGYGKYHKYYKYHKMYDKYHKSHHDDNKYDSCYGSCRYDSSRYPSSTGTND